jgi:hypothetical protein
MNRHLRNLAAILVGAAIGLSGCSSIPKTDGALAAEIAKQEMRRRGWKRIEVYTCMSRDGVWVVTLGTRGHRRAVDLAWVRVSPKGDVLDVILNDR